MTYKTINQIVTDTMAAITACSQLIEQYHQQHLETIGEMKVKLAEHLVVIGGEERQNAIVSGFYFSFIVRILSWTVDFLSTVS